MEYVTINAVSFDVMRFLVLFFFLMLVIAIFYILHKIDDCKGERRKRQIAEAKLAAFQKRDEDALYKIKYKKQLEKLNLAGGNIAEVMPEKRNTNG